jgi:PPOX class probable F420-dependent enzyme
VALEDSKYVRLTTFRRDGTPVATPVWIVKLSDDRFGFWTSSGSGKAKRLAHTARVTVVPSDARGRVKPGTDILDANAHLVTGSELEAIRQRVVAKYGIATKFTKLIGTLIGIARGKRIPYGDRGVVIELAPPASQMARPESKNVGHEQLLRAAYEAFNARDIETALEQMTPDVDWPNAWEGGRVLGHDAVRDYWTRQWAAIDPTVEPLAFTERPGASVAVDVLQSVRDLDGALLSEDRVLHVFVLRDGLLARMDVEEISGGGASPAG